MKNLILSILSSLFIILLPLFFKPYLIIHTKIIIICSGCILMWLTQPIFTVKETKEKKDSDKSSVLLILLMTSLSSMLPVFIWAFFSEDRDSFSIGAIIGIGLLIIGLAVRTWAVQELGKYFTPTVQIQSDHELITTGPFSIIRHPSYLGAFLAVTSFALILQVYIGYLIAIIAMGIAYKVRIAIEEKELTAHFGVLYQNYSKRTKKMIPFIL